MAQVKTALHVIPVCSQHLTATASSALQIITPMEVGGVNSVLAPQLRILALSTSGGTTCLVMPAFLAVVCQALVSRLGVYGKTDSHSCCDTSRWLVTSHS